MSQRMVPGTGPNDVEASPSRWRRLIERFAGPQLVDLPIRLLAVIYVITGSSPRAYESFEPGYVMVHVLGQASYVAAAFWPAAAGLSATALFAAFLFVYPEFINPMLEPIAFSAAVLLAKHRWRFALLFSASAVFAVALEHVAGIAMPTPFSLVAFILGTNLALASAGAYLAWRVEHETALRVAAAQSVEQRVHDERLATVTDIHDTLAHSHASQAAIIQLITAEGDPAERRRLFGELALANDDAQQQFRTLLTRLAATESSISTDEVPFGIEIRRVLEHLRDAAARGGLDIGTTVTELPALAPPDLVEDLTHVLREIVTNMMRHADPGICHIAIAHEAAAERPIVVVATNPSSRSPNSDPLTINRRVVARGGTSNVTHSDGTFQLTVALPLGRRNYPDQSMHRTGAPEFNGAYGSTPRTTEHHDVPARTRPSTSSGTT